MAEYRLKAVYFPGKDTRLGYYKAMVYENEMDFFLSMGASTSPPEDEIEEDIALSEEGDGDRGSGKPGSLQWHTESINGLSRRKDILTYMRDLVGEEAFPFFSNEKTVDTRKRALRYLKGVNDDHSE